MTVNFDKFFEATDAGFIKADLGWKQELTSGGKTKKMVKVPAKTVIPGFFHSRI
jgi:hypothetical protein